MEIFGGFMMMLSILGFFLTVIWFILPFVIFNIKGRVERSLVILEELDRRLVAIEATLKAREVATVQEQPVHAVEVAAPHE
ncbi:hypothetical protein GMLC_06720 [Geomonas limicola]|uniref:Uncharacterized protein n=1 Tax=Geomonas limicola TaxID=2740186 RepID=A0A6V8N6A3_9BACT|nr:hypothetical protein [Geomonas limicola]GFO67093.1 hypothetical protein GMLC_06720 [Geomonas limicola]